MTEPTINTKDALEAAIGTAVREAFDHDVEVEGAYPIRNGPGTPDWQAEITELAKPDGTVGTHPT